MSDNMIAAICLAIIIPPLVGLYLRWSTKKYLRKLWTEAYLTRRETETASLVQVKELPANKVKVIKPPQS